MLRRFVGSVHLMLLLGMTFSFSSHAGIKLSIHLNDDLDSSRVSASGFELIPLNDGVAKAFGIPRQIVGRGYDDKLWSVIKNWWGRVPDEFVTSDPVIGSSANVPKKWTPYADSWGLENQVMVERKAVGVTIIETTGSVDSVATSRVRNMSDTLQQGQEIELTYAEELEDSRYSEKNWSMSLTNGIEVSVSGEYAGFGAEATRSIEFTVETGGTKGKSHTVSHERSMRMKANVDAEPKTMYPVSVVAGKGSLKVKIDYEYRLRGKWRALYHQKPYNGQMAAPLSDVVELLRALKKPLVIKASEVLDIGFVTDGEISIGEGTPVYHEVIADALERTIKKKEEYTDRGIDKGAARLERVINTLKGKIEMYGEEAETHLENVIKNGDKQTVIMWKTIIDAFEEIGVPRDENEAKDRETASVINDDGMVSDNPKWSAAIEEIEQIIKSLSDNEYEIWLRIKTESGDSGE